MESNLPIPIKLAPLSFKNWGLAVHLAYNYPCS